MKKKEILPMKEVEWLVLHSSATRCNKSFTFEDLKRCHRAKGYAYDCGYHWYITRDGEYHEGCYEGGLDEKGRPADTRTEAQKAAILFLLKDLKNDYPNAKVVGHRDFPNVKKECPCLDVASDPDYRQLNLD